MTTPSSPRHKAKSATSHLDGSSVTCPFCESTNTRKESDFGTTLAYSQFYCKNCRTMFEWLKWEDGADDQNLPKFLTKPVAQRLC